MGSVTLWTGYVLIPALRRKARGPIAAKISAAGAVSGGSAAPR